jgi:hypothetical protein
VQAEYLRDKLAGTYTIRSVTLIDGDWTSLLKTSRERFIVPDQELDEALLSELESDGNSRGDASQSPDVRGKRVMTGAPPQVRCNLSPCSIGKPMQQPAARP